MHALSETRRPRARYKRAVEAVRHPGSPPPLIGLALVNMLAVILAGSAVTVGVSLGEIAQAPGFVGVGVLGFAGGLATLLGSVRPREAEPRVHGSTALALISTILAAGFLFGPTSVIVAVGVPLTGILTLKKLGRDWGTGVLLFGFAGAAALFGLTLAEVLPYRPAITSPGQPDVVWGSFELSMMLFGIALALGFVNDLPAPRVPTPRPGPARTGSYTADQLQRITLSDRYSPEELDQRGLSVTGVPEDGPDMETTLELQKLESLGVLAGGIAHDFNNLLMSILGNSSLALMEVDGGGNIVQPIREIEVAAKRARDLVGQLLAYAGKGTIAEDPLDLGQLVKEMGDLLATGSRKVPIDYDICNAVPLIVADPTQIRQIAMNLITNGADSMAGREGRIRVSIQILHLDRQALDRTLLGLGCQVGAYVQLAVADDGCGMDATTLARIFDPFYTTKKTGRGLGLAAVIGIVRRAGGTMEVESEQDHGTTFRIYFPYAEAIDEDEDLPTEHTSTAQGWAAAKTGAILVVDDDLVVLRVTTRMVKRLKFEVIEACDGESALRAFDADRDRILVTLLDMTMPGMDGIETLAAIRERVPDAPVILTSGYSEADIPKTGAIFLQKPYTMKQLSRAFDQALE